MGLVVAAAVAVRVRVFAGLDLRDLAGPGGVQIIAALTEGNPERDNASAFFAAFSPLFSDAESATRVVCGLGGVLAVLGAALAGRGLAGRTGAVVAGLVAAFWSQAVYVSLLLGGGGPAMGLAWLGAGLALVSARLGWIGVVLAPVGLALAVEGIEVKESALPVVAVIAVAPLLVPRGRWKLGVALAAALAVAGWFSQDVLVPGETTHVAEVPAPSWAVITSGWERLRVLLQSYAEGLVMGPLAAVAVVGALLPGRRWLGRLLLGVLGGLALCFTAEAVGDRLRPRVITAAALPAVLLVGCAVGIGVDHVRAVLAWLFPETRKASVALAGVALLVLFPLWQDTMAFHEAWALLRVEHLGARAPALPSATPAWRAHYQRVGDLDFNGTSDQGALDLVRLGREAPPGGVASVPLRDARHYHMRAGAGLVGKPALVLDVPRCCLDGEDPSTCARRIVDALDGAGMTLLLPVQVGRTPRVPRRHHAFWMALDDAAGQAGGVSTEGPWWRVRPAGGTGGTAPCIENDR
jgi:hypothetical protein